MKIFALALSCALLSLVIACPAAEVKPTRAKASAKGAGVAVADPTVRIAAGTTCPEGTAESVGPRMKSATAGALTSGGFKVVDGAEAEKAPYTTGLDIEITYCSEAGIVSGTSALELKRGGGSVWRQQATGDLARGETAASTLNELVEIMLYDPAVIAAMSSGAGS